MDLHSIKAKKPRQALSDVLYIEIIAITVNNSSLEICKDAVNSTFWPGNASGSQNKLNPSRSALSALLLPKHAYRLTCDHPNARHQEIRKSRLAEVAFEGHGGREEDEDKTDSIVLSY